MVSTVLAGIANDDEVDDERLVVDEVELLTAGNDVIMVAGKSWVLLLFNG